MCISFFCVSTTSPGLLNWTNQLPVALSKFRSNIGVIFFFLENDNYFFDNHLNIFFNLAFSIVWNLVILPRKAKICLTIGNCVDSLMHVFQNLKVGTMAAKTYWQLFEKFVLNFNVNNLMNFYNNSISITVEEAKIQGNCGKGDYP